MNDEGAEFWLPRNTYRNGNGVYHTDRSCRLLSQAAGVRPIASEEQLPEDVRLCKDCAGEHPAAAGGGKEHYMAAVNAGESE